MLIPLQIEGVPSSPFLHQMPALLVDCEKDVDVEGDMVHGEAVANMVRGLRVSTHGRVVRGQGVGCWLGIQGGGGMLGVVRGYGEAVETKPGVPMFSAATPAPPAALQCVHACTAQTLRCRVLLPAPASSP